MTFDAELTPGRVAAWDRYAHNAQWCGIYELRGNRATLIDSTERARTNDTIAALLARHIRIGSVYRTTGFLWTVDGVNLELWPTVEDNGALLRKAGDELKLNGRTFAAADVTAVISFFDEQDYGHRGVKLALKTEQVVVAEERDSTPELDPTYGLNNLLIDAGWITHLGHDLATCLRVPHRDQLQVGQP